MAIETVNMDRQPTLTERDLRRPDHMLFWMHSQMIPTRMPWGLEALKRHILNAGSQYFALTAQERQVLDTSVHGGLKVILGDMGSDYRACEITTSEGRLLGYTNVSPVNDGLVQAWATDEDDKRVLEDTHVFVSQVQVPKNLIVSMLSNIHLGDLWGDGGRPLVWVENIYERTDESGQEYTVINVVLGWVEVADGVWVPDFHTGFYELDSQEFMDRVGGLLFEADRVELTRTVELTPEEAQDLHDSERE